MTKKKKSLNAKELVLQAKTRRHQRAVKRKQEAQRQEQAAHRREVLDKAILAALSAKQPRPVPVDQEDVLPTTPTTFHRFKKLPAELRRIIWEYALPGPRIFEPFSTREASVEEIPCHLLHKHAPPAIRGVCKESWHITEEHGFFTFGKFQALRGEWCDENCKLNGFWFNPNRDIVYLSRKREDTGRADYRGFWCPETEMDDDGESPSDYLAFIKACKPRVIAFRFQFVHDRPAAARRYVVAADNVDTIMLMCEDDNMVKQPWFLKPQAYPLDPADLVLLCSEGNRHAGEQPREWAEVQQKTIASFWGTRDGVRYTGTPERLPALAKFKGNFCGMQVIRKGTWRSVVSQIDKA